MDTFSSFNSMSWEALVGASLKLQLAIKGGLTATQKVEALKGLQATWRPMEALLASMSDEEANRASSDYLRRSRRLGLLRP